MLGLCWTYAGPMLGQGTISISVIFGPLLSPRPRVMMEKK